MVKEIVCAVCGYRGIKRITQGSILIELHFGFSLSYPDSVVAFGDYVTIGKLAKNVRNLLLFQPTHLWGKKLLEI